MEFEAIVEMILQEIEAAWEGTATKLIRLCLEDSLDPYVDPNLPAGTLFSPRPPGRKPTAPKSPFFFYRRARNVGPGRASCHMPALAGRAADGMPLLTQRTDNTVKTKSLNFRIR